MTALPEAAYGVGVAVPCDHVLRRRVVDLHARVGYAARAPAADDVELAADEAAGRVLAGVLGRGQLRPGVGVRVVRVERVGVVQLRRSRARSRACRCRTRRCCPRWRWGSRQSPARPSRRSAQRAAARRAFFAVLFFFAASAASPVLVGPATRSVGAVAAGRTCWVKPPSYSPTFTVAGAVPVFVRVILWLAVPPQATVLPTEAGVTAIRPAAMEKSDSTSAPFATVAVAVPAA